MYSYVSGISGREESAACLEPSEEDEESCLRVESSAVVDDSVAVEEALTPVAFARAEENDQARSSEVSASVSRIKESEKTISYYKLLGELWDARSVNLPAEMLIGRH